MKSKIIFLLVIAISLNSIANGSKEQELRAKLIGFQSKIDYMFQLLDESFLLSRDWVFTDRVSNTPSKIKLKNILDNKIIDSCFGEILTYQYYFPSDLFDKLLYVSAQIQSIQYEIKYMMDQLNSFESYDDPFIIFEITPTVEYGGSINQSISEVKENLTLLNLYFTTILSHKKVWPTIESNIKNKNKRQLIVQLLDLMEVRDELIENTMDPFIPDEYFNEDTKALLRDGMFKLIIDYYDSLFSETEIKQLLNFYSSNPGKKIIDSQGVLSIKLFDSIFNKAYKDL